MQRLPSSGAGAWRCAPLLPWRVQCPTGFCRAIAAGQGGGAGLVSLLPCCPSCYGFEQQQNSERANAQSGTADCRH